MEMKVLISKEQIDLRVEELARQIKADYGDAPIVLICVLKGAFPFCANLFEKLGSPKVELEFIQISSYGNSSNSSGSAVVVSPLTGPITGKDVIVIEDIVDTGVTFGYLKRYLSGLNPSSIRLASLLRKKARLQIETEIDYLGFDIEDKFVIGYGLDDKGFSRGLPFVGYLE